MTKGLLVLLGLLCLIGTTGAMGSPNFNMGWNVIRWKRRLYSLTVTQHGKYSRADHRDLALGDIDSDST